MLCEKCKEKMNWYVEGAVQGWVCPACDWSIITTHINEIDADQTEYSLYIRNAFGIDIEKIRFVAKTANVSFIIAKHLLEEQIEVCILKARAPKIKETIAELQKLSIDFRVSPLFKY